MRRVAALLLLIAARVAHATPLSDDLHAEAQRSYDQAKDFFRDKDFVAAAVMFDQAQLIWGRLEHDESGAVVDQDAHVKRGLAISNKASSYAQANMPVEAEDAFQQRRDLYGKELSPEDLQALDDAIANMKAQIGTVTLAGMPADAAASAEVHIDGRMAPKQIASGPIRMAEGDHSIEISADGYHDLLDDFTIVPGRNTDVIVKLEPLQTPARVRIEADRTYANVELDGKPIGKAPVEVTVAPGPHRFAIDAFSYQLHRGEIDVKPGERTVIHASLVPRRAPHGLRLVTYFLGLGSLRTGTPLGDFTGALGLQALPGLLRWRTIRVGVNFEYHARDLEPVVAGALVGICPDRFVWRGGTIAWCPFTGFADFLFGGHKDIFSAGVGSLRANTVLELRRGMSYVHLAAGMALESYRRDPDGAIPNLFAATFEVGVGFDL